ncbi:MAG TPA: hypothetical protein VGN37_26355 [Actinocatenispora sp.]
MTITSTATRLTTRLLRPENLPVDRVEKDIAHRAVERAYTRGQVDEKRAGDLRAAVDTAHTRAELDASMAGVPGAVRTPGGLNTAVRIVTALSVVSTVVQVVVWFAIGVRGGWDTPWWLWSATVGAAIVAGLWWAAEWPRRSARLAHTGYART